MKEKYAITLDWLEVAGYCSPISDGVYQNNGFNYRSHYISTYTFSVSDTNVESALFKKLLDVRCEGLLVAKIQQLPRSSALKHGLTLIKLENRVLYSTGYISMLYALMDAVGFEYNNITRLDVCCDCNKLSGGKDVGEFLRDFITVKAATVGHIIRSGSTRFAAYGSRKWVGDAQITSMRFGSLKSKKGAYVYNKTLELIEVKDKPWIREWWRNCGLVSEVNERELRELTEDERTFRKEQHTLVDYCKESVWRFEISLSSEATKVVSLDTGELFSLSPDKVTNQEQIENLFISLSAEVFDFRINTGQKNRRFYKKVVLWDFCGAPNMKTTQISRKLDAGRMEKMCANKLLALYEQYRSERNVPLHSILDTWEFLRHISGCKEWSTKMLKDAARLDSLKSFMTELAEEGKVLESMDILQEARMRGF